MRPAEFSIFDSGFWIIRVPLAVTGRKPVMAAQK
jgi:hypothetical protein